MFYFSVIVCGCKCTYFHFSCMLFSQPVNFLGIIFYCCKRQRINDGKGTAKERITKRIISDGTNKRHRTKAGANEFNFNKRVKTNNE